MTGFNVDDYVDVAQRIHDFYERYPEGRLTTVDWEVKDDLGGKAFVWVHAKAYRTPDDPLPGDGIAWEPVPGPTQFTKDSELMNAQTAAWGRAIVALGFDTKKIASKQEVQARNGDPHGLRESRADAGTATAKQKDYIRRLAKELNLEPGDLDSLTKAQAGARIEELINVKDMTKEAAPVGGGPDPLDDIPFA